MTLRTLAIGGLLVPALLALAGCVPSVQSQSDEQKESHFLAGKSRVSTMDYKGAIEAFEKALEVNPHSASAHFELGCLYDQADPAAAIYHYEQYLKLRPDAGNPDVVKQRISTCKQELARNVYLGPLTERQQRDLEQLSLKNKALEEEVKRLSELAENWRVYATRLQGLTNNAPAAQPRSGTQTSLAPPPTNYANPTRSLGVTAGRTHTVKPGETLASIARKYGVKLDALSAANPRVDSRKLQVGFVLQVPSS